MEGRLPQRDDQVTFADLLATDDPIERERLIAGLVARMSLKEKIEEMTGNSGWPKLAVMAVRYGLWTFDSGKIARLGIPALRFTDGPRGVCLNHSTCFPVAIARGATWDADLNRRVGSAVGYEARAQGANFYGGVCINVLRHPGWGRAQETFGEDPFHLGLLGVATVEGAQRHLMACAKHFACNSIEEARFFVDVKVDERTLREVYLPHFKKCVDAGVASIMSAYNKVNGTYCGHNEHLQRDILKHDWEFDGLVMSDFVWGVRNGLAAAKGGMDIEMPKRWRFGRRFKKAVKHGDVPEKLLDESVTRILRQKARFAGVGSSSEYDRGHVAGREHAELALEVARKSIVLLKNEGGALPLEREELKSIAVIGLLGALPNIGDRGSSRVNPPYVITPLQGLRNRAGAVDVLYDNAKDMSTALPKAAGADAAIVVAGLNYKQEGEFLSSIAMVGGDREDLSLPTAQVEMIKAVAGVNDRCVVVLEGGSAVTLGEWIDYVQAVVMLWYPGMEGGHAIAEVLYGDTNPSGRLPFTWHRSVDQLPFFDKKAKSMDYGYFHGYRHFEREGLDPQFPFGFGLSYTTCEYGPVSVDKGSIGKDGSVTVSSSVTNTGTLPGEEVAQLYIGYPHSSVVRPVKELKGFARVGLGPGDTKAVSFKVDTADLAYYETDNGEWIVEEMEYVAQVGPSSGDSDLRGGASFKVE